MNYGKVNVIAILLASCFGTPIAGQSTSWNGMWALDSNSQEAKPEISFLTKPDGTYELVSSTIISPFRCDGKPYPRLGRAGQAGVGDAVCTSLSKTSVDLTFSAKDRPPIVGHLQVSGDSKGLIYTFETSNPSEKKR
jgi:hypothetical protein